jgi:cytochrome c553
MKYLVSWLIVTATVGVTFATSAQAYDGDWKRGRVYFRQVCTSCHLSASGKTISPADRVKAEWSNYLTADKHDVKGKTNHSVKYYVSREYRQSIAGQNKAAEKYLEVPVTELHADIVAFVAYGAKDSDNPSRCQ